MLVVLAYQTGLVESGAAHTDRIEDPRG